MKAVLLGLACTGALVGLLLQRLKGRGQRAQVVHVSANCVSWQVCARLLPHDPASCDKILAAHRVSSNLRVVGLDVEWQPERDGQHHPVALLQLALADTCLLVHLIHMDSVPQQLAAILADPGIIKVGIGIATDMQRLHLDFGLVSRSAVDLRQVAQAEGSSLLQQGSSLGAISHALLGVAVDKSQQCSEWASAQLSPAQISYAALDAWLSRTIALELYRYTCTARPGVSSAVDSTSTGSAAHAAPGAAAAAAGGGGGVRAGQSSSGPMSASCLPTSHPPKHPATPSDTKCATRPQPAAAAAGPLHSAAQDLQGLDLEDDVQCAAWLTGYLLPLADLAASATATRSTSAAPAASSGAASAPAAAAAPRHHTSSSSSSQAAALAACFAGIPGHIAADCPEAAAAGGSGSTSKSSSNKPQLQLKPLRPACLPTRKSVQYENCRILAPDDTVLCTCGSKKVSWYVSRGLGTVVSSDPVTVQLKFEPRGRGHADDSYYLSEKDNCCCVCGATDNYLRHSIVPHCYRQHFPAHMKSHLSHDIVLLCMGCHQLCNAFDTRRMQDLGRLYGAPLEADAHRFRTDSQLSAVRSAGRALASARAAIPAARREELQQVLVDHFRLGSAQQLSQQHVEQAAALDPRQTRQDWASHASMVVAAVVAAEQQRQQASGTSSHCMPAGAVSNEKARGDTTGNTHAATADTRQLKGSPAAAAGAATTSKNSSSDTSLQAGAGTAGHASLPVATAALTGFVRGWRQHFLDVMRPGHLPAFWSVDARVSNSSV